MYDRRTSRAIVALTVVVFLISGQVCAGQGIVGSVSICNAAGQNVYGERIAVFLVRTASPVSADHCRRDDHRQRLLDCINGCHLDFFKRFQTMQQDPDYLIDQTVTSETGNFAFLDAPVGNFYILIKFPAMIDGYKVAWQEPVTVDPQRIRFVTLNEENLVLPKNRRR